MTLRCREVATLTHGRAAIKPGHVGFGTGFIEANEVPKIDKASRQGEADTPANYFRTFLFTGSKRLFFKDHPSFFRARHTAIRLQRSPISSAMRFRKHSKVASGSRCSH